MGDLGAEELYLFDEGPEGSDECQDDRPVDLCLEFAGCAGGRATQMSEEFGGLLPAAVAVAEPWRARKPERRFSPSPRASWGLG